MPDRIRGLAILGVLVALLAVVVTGLASGAGRPADRAYELEQRLRCPVCKSVSIAESMSDTAVAMRATVEEQIDAGRSDEEIIDYFVGRYGEWVLMDPPVGGSTLALWLIPLGAAAVGVILLAMRRRKPEKVPELSPGDRERVASAVARLRAEDDDADGPL